MKRLIPLLFILTALPLTAAGLKNDDFLLRSEKTRKMQINNRVLAVVNGKPITVVDVMKKMDMIFHQQFREYSDNIEARHQFYSMQWKRVLQELIDKEVILADAIENQLPITNGDVRQEMETLFGPNIIASLDQMDMGYDEAFEMVKGDLLIRRMMMMRVNLKAMRKVTPQTVQQHYEEFAKENVVPARWTYQVISVRHPDSKVGADVAQTAYALLGAEIALGQLKTRLESVGVVNDAVVNVSQTFDLAEGEVSPNNLEVLKTLGVNEYSKPVAEQSRKDNSLVHRIYYLVNKEEGGAVPFTDAEKKIYNKLMDDAIELESIAYLKKLRQHYGVSETLLKDLTVDEFKPFELTP